MSKRRPKASAATHKTQAKDQTVVQPALPRRKISYDTLAAASANPKARNPAGFTIPEPPPGVLPEGAQSMAMDYGISDNLAYLNRSAGLGIHWLGYPLLAEAAQVPEVRRLAEVVAREITRKFVKIVAAGEEDKTDKIKTLEAAFDRYRVREIFRELAMMDCLFGRSHLYFDFDTTDDAAELQTPLILSPNKIAKGSLKRLLPVEATWTFAQDYGTRSPLKPDFYEPQSWIVMGQKIHKSRLLTFIGRPVPQILRASFAFGGLSLTQMALPVIQGWTDVRKAIVDLIKSFAVSGIRTNMGATLMGTGGDDMILRAELFNQTRNNRNLMMLDKETEEFFTVATPLGTLDHLQAQALEHICALSGTPTAIYAGLTPSGLNASSEGEIRIWYSWCESYREQLFRTHLETTLKVMQLNEFGVIDDQIKVDFIPLWEMNETERAVIRKTDVDTAVELINAGVLNPIEERQRLANTEDSLYHGLDINDVPEPPEDPDTGLMPDPAKGQEHEDA